MFHESTKHTKIDCYFVQEKLLPMEICKFIKSNYPLVDVLTRSLKGTQIELICSKLGTYNLYAPTSRRVLK